MELNSMRLQQALTAMGGSPPATPHYHHCRPVANPALPLLMTAPQLAGAHQQQARSDYNGLLCLYEGLLLRHAF